MGIFSQLRNRIKDKQMGMAQPVGRGGGFFGGLPFAKERMPIGDMRFRDPRFEGSRRRRGIAGLFGRMPEKVPFGPVSQPEMMSPQMMQPQLFGRPTEGIPSPDINLQNIPTLPDFSQGLPPEILERIQGNMQRMGRLPFADGEEVSTQSLIDFLNSDQEQVDFGKSVSNESQRQFDYLTDILKRTESSEEKIQLLNQMKETFGKDLLMNIASGNVVGKDFSNLDREIASKLYIGVSPEDILRPKYGDAIEGRTISDMDRQMIKGYEGGGEVFPDLTGDGKVTQADILKGRGVFAEGDEVSMMMMEMEGDQGMSASDMEGLEELGEISGPETEMLNNIINQIIELIAQGATEEEVIAFLRQQGLDEEDISAVMSMLSQQLTAGEEEGIDSQLAALG